MNEAAPPPAPDAAAMGGAPEPADGADRASRYDATSPGAGAMPTIDKSGAEVGSTRTHAQRRAAALEVYRGFTKGEFDAERAQRAMTRRLGALGTYAFDVVMGDVWSRPQLSRRDRSLIVIAVLAAIGSVEELSLHTEIGLNHGLTRSEIEEILLHVAAYAGFPMAMAASRVVDDRFRTLDNVERLPERPPAAELSDAEREHRAAEVRRAMTAPHEPLDDEADVPQQVAMLGEVGRVAYRWALGDLWSRDELARRDRSIVVIAILTALGCCDDLTLHIPAGLNHSLTRTEIEEILVQLTIYAGIPRAQAAHRTMQQAFKRIDTIGRRLNTPSK